MNKLAMSIRIVKYTSFAIFVSLLIGCGGTKTVITADDSAEYRNAISLPPLKKPAKPTVVSSDAVSSGLSAEPLVSEAEALDQLSADSAKISSVTQEPFAGAEAPMTTIASASVIELDGDRARLKIDSDLDSAWSYVSENLRLSGITVHTRNKTAGRFAIGCASLQTNPEATSKRDGWSFFSKKDKPTEHCSLLLTGGRSATQARLLSRNGAEYNSSDSKALFARLLNN